MELIVVFVVVGIVAGLALVALALWAACVVSGRISRKEERNG